MTSSIYLIDASGTNIHLAGTGTPYTGSGTPWTSQATSPYELSMNERTPIWTPAAPLRQEIYGGGPPFSIGSALVARGYGNVEESVGVQMRATSHDNAVTLLRTLRRALASTLTSRPPILAVQPSGSSQTAYYEIYGATVQETTDFINEEAGLATRLVRATITWVRSPFGGRLGGGETLINGVTVTNSSTTVTNPNLVSLGSNGAGDLTVEGGQPLNFSYTFSANVVPRAYVAVVAARHVQTASSALTGSGATLTLTSTTAFDPLLTNPNLRARLLARVTGANSELEVAGLMYFGTSGIPEFPTTRGPWVRAWTGGGAADVLLDLGDLAIPPLADTGFGIYEPRVRILARSVTGGATAGTLAVIEILLYYTFSEIRASRGMNTGNRTMELRTFTQTSGRPALPLPVARGYITDSGHLSRPAVRLVGPVPCYIPGASLWTAWTDSPDGATGTYSGPVQNTAHTATLTVTQAPLYHTLRGGG